MTAYDIFNGDADGICALVQLRLAAPRKTTLVTGVKRDIALLDKINAKAGDHLTVLDISMRENKTSLMRALDIGAHVFYVDHHNTGDIPKHENLFAVIDTRPKTCTSLLVNTCLDNAYAEWAVMAAYGDNLFKSAEALADRLDIHPPERRRLQTLGELINYNGYGSEISDLHYAPAKLYQHLCPYTSPLLCLKDQPDIFKTLETGRAEDLAKAQNSTQLTHNITILDDAPWARRISGTYANHLATQSPDTPHALLTHNTKGGYTISVRAALIPPNNKPNGAGDFCAQFPTGGGRAAAGGINHLPKNQLNFFIKKFHSFP